MRNIDKDYLTGYAISDYRYTLNYLRKDDMYGGSGCEYEMPFNISLCQYQSAPVIAQIGYAGGSTLFI